MRELTDNDMAEFTAIIVKRVGEDYNPEIASSLKTFLAMAYLSANRLTDSTPEDSRDLIIELANKYVDKFNELEDDE